MKGIPEFSLLGDSAKVASMTTDYLLGIFNWRDHAGDLDGPQHSIAGFRTLLWGCERWMESQPDAAETDDGRRLLMIKAELEEWIQRYDHSGGDGG